MAAFKPVPDSLWLRLAALEPRWSFCLGRERRWLIAGEVKARVWSGVGGPRSPTRGVWRARFFPADAAEPDLADGRAATVGGQEMRRR